MYFSGSFNAPKDLILSSILLINSLFFLPPPANTLFKAPSMGSIKYSYKISEVYSVKVAAPSFNDNPFTKDILKSPTS